MKFSVATILAAASAVSASTGLVGNITYTTEVVTAYTTYCPEATTLTYGAQTYTISQATTLTITDCPCTISKPVYTSSYVVCSTCTPKPSNNETVPTTTGPSGRVPTGTYTPTPSIMTAGAAKAMVASGAGLAGVMAVALAL